MGISRDPARLGYIANDTLRLFVDELLKDAEDQPIAWKLDARQALCDLGVLRKFANLWVDSWVETSRLLDEWIGQLQEKVCHVRLGLLLLNVLSISASTARYLNS